MRNFLIVSLAIFPVVRRDEFTRDKAKKIRGCARLAVSSSDFFTQSIKMVRHGGGAAVRINIGRQLWRLN